MQTISIPFTAVLETNHVEFDGSFFPDLSGNSALYAKWRESDSFIVARLSSEDDLINVKDKDGIVFFTSFSTITWENNSETIKF